MNEAAEQLLRRIQRASEDTFLELKRVVMKGPRVGGPKADDLADEVAAMANAQGGSVVLGVDDTTGEILGVDRRDTDAVEAFVREVTRDKIEPRIDHLTTEWLFLPGEGGDERAVLRLTVDRSLFVHRSPGGHFHRVGSEKRKMSDDYLRRLQFQRSRSGVLSFDETRVASASVADLDERLTHRFFPPGLDQTPGQILEKLGMAERDEEHSLRPTVAGVLMGCRKPADFLPDAFVQAVAYRGKDITAGPGYQLDAADLHGPLDEQVVAACRFVAKNMRVSADKTAGRTDHPQFDITAVFEAMVNAVAHRDYAMHGTSIRLRQFADRIELSVPGSLVNSMTLEDLPYQQHARNPVLNGLLARTPVPGDLPWLNTGRTAMMDRRGEGVPVILALGEAVAGRKPEYALTGTSAVRLTLFARPDPAEGEAFDA